ncbi:hypothetical protein ES703_109651 [subsurface metagenome]
MILFIFIGSLFCLAGCAQLYKLIGLTPEQTADQIGKDQKAIAKVLDTARLDITQLITTIIAGIGAIASGFLAKWLGTERKITKVLITGIENADTTEVKQAVKANALSAGVESQLHARVKALT